MQCMMKPYPMYFETQDNQVKTWKFKSSHSHGTTIMTR